MPLDLTPQELERAARRAAELEAEDPSPRVLAGRTGVATADLDHLLTLERRVRLVAGAVDLVAIAVTVLLGSAWPLAAIVVSRVGSFAISETAESRLRRGRQPPRRAQA